MTIRKERPMRKVSPLLLAASVALSCGTSNPSNRRLQSITINVLGRGAQVQFTATGNFSSPPLTVTPLPVSWSLGLMAPPSKTLQYTLTTQPYEYVCPGPGQYGPITVVAPADPSAPQSGTLPFTQMITGSGPIPCL
jgi:hypothetical protein